MLANVENGAYLCDVVGFRVKMASKTSLRQLAQRFH